VRNLGSPCAVAEELEAQSCDPQSVLRGGQLLGTLVRFSRDDPAALQRQQVQEQEQVAAQAAAVMLARDRDFNSAVSAHQTAQRSDAHEEHDEEEEVNFPEKGFLFHIPYTFHISHTHTCTYIYIDRWWRRLLPFSGV
jgi:hypothetical protein